MICISFPAPGHVTGAFSPVNLSCMKKPAKSRKKQPAKDQQTLKPETIEEKEEKPFDFGGIPARDLKKNLGCG